MNLLKLSIARNLLLSLSFSHVARVMHAHLHSGRGSSNQFLNMSDIPFLVAGLNWKDGFDFTSSSCTECVVYSSRTC